MDLCTNNGELEDFYLEMGETKEKLTLEELIKELEEFVNGDYLRNTGTRNNDQKTNSGNFIQNVSSEDEIQNASSGVDVKM